jgi:predicted flap endonuclease-1-like 5' DNA nuclease
MLDLDVEVIEGVGPVCGGLLKNAGVKTVNDLLTAGSKEAGRRRLANDVGVSYLTLVKWVYQADLFRIKGVDAKYSALLESAGVNTVADLSEKDPALLSNVLRAVNMERKLVERRSLSVETIGGWVIKAKKLKTMVE